MFWQPLHECKAEEEHVVFLCVLTEMGQVGPRGRGGRHPFPEPVSKVSMCPFSDPHKKMKMRN